MSSQSTSTGLRLPAPGSQDGIRKLNRENAQAFGSAFLELLADWKSYEVRPADGSAEDVEWKARANDAEKMIARFVKAPTDTTIACFFEKKPVGLLALEIPEEVSLFGIEPRYSAGLSVEIIATHPGSTGVGSALVEEAATASHQQGYLGRLQLTPATEKSKDVYRALGFVEDGPKWTLNPASPENKARWSCQDERWTLKKYLTKDLATGFSAFCQAGDRGKQRPD